MKNVLVYSGQGVSQTSLTYTLSSLRDLLLPDYAVQPITAKALSTEPWSSNCALLVIPGGRDLPYLHALTSAAAPISDYVHRGGAFMGICAGAYFASQRIRWEAGTPLAVVGERPLGFFPGLSTGCAYPGFQYESEDGARLVSLDTTGSRPCFLYYNGGGEFVGTESMDLSMIEVIGRYQDEVEQEHDLGRAAAVSCTVGSGRAILWHAHLEYPLDLEPAKSASLKLPHPPSVDELRQLESMRVDVLRNTLSRLGLKPASYRGALASKPVLLPQVLVFRTPTIAQSVTKAIFTALRPHLQNFGHPVQVLVDTNDSFNFHSSPETVPPPTQIDDLNAVPKHIVIHDTAKVPLKRNFDIAKFYNDLTEARGSEMMNYELGDTLLYGPIVTSTQTMLDGNPLFAASLPSPFLSLATVQVAGRGRGTNVWVSPLVGGLQFSLLLRPPTSLPNSRLVFIQYLFSLAIVEACRKVMGPTGERVRLKWPNDIYAEENGELSKLGGILVNVSFSGSGQAQIVIGCGLNILNPPPTKSLLQLGASDLTMETTFAVVLTTFEGMWRTFLAHGGSFEPFMDLYIARWLHSNQLVVVDTTTPPTSVRIIGITSDYGLLRTIKDPDVGTTPKYIDLQPDGNSFDMMKGLIRSKS